MHIKTWTLFICALLTVCCGFAADTAKPKLKVAADGFPSGHDTPEGVACDFARAFIQNDSILFRNSCIRLYQSGKGPKKYADLLQEVSEGMEKEAAAKIPAAANEPKSIEKVFAARHLSKNGPGSYGYAMFSFQDLVFVDLDSALYSGTRAPQRILVIKDKDGKWYVHPLPAVDELLSMGLNDEPASAQDFSEAYEVQK